MARRGRPPYPDVLTPREFEVLALLREDLSNEEIAGRLGISLAGAKYHVSEILSQLGVASREEAAAWSASGGRPWAFVSLAWVRRLGWPQAAALVAAMAVAAGLGLLVWGLVRTNGGSASPQVALATDTALAYIGGTIDAISEQQLVVRDVEGHLVTIRLEHAQGPEAQFCHHATPFDYCQIMREAAPTTGQHVCVTTRFLPDGGLLAWFVQLDAQCSFVPVTPAPTS